MARAWQSAKYFCGTYGIAAVLVIVGLFGKSRRDIDLVCRRLQSVEVSHDVAE